MKFPKRKLEVAITLMNAFSHGFCFNDTTRNPWSLSLISGNDDLWDDLSRRSEDLAVEKERNRLEELNKRSFLKRKPQKLAYEDARRWIQANIGASTKEEFEDMVENGNLRTPYISKRPEEYYTERNEWISWDHFLTGIFDKKNPSGIRPPTGSFD